MNACGLGPLKLILDEERRGELPCSMCFEQGSYVDEAGVVQGWSTALEWWWGHSF